MSPGAPMSEYEKTTSSCLESRKPATQYVFPKLFRFIMLVYRLYRLLSMHCADRMWYSFDAKTLLAWGCTGDISRVSPNASRIASSHQDDVEGRS